MSGFISGSAVLIVFSQFKYLLGLSIHSADPAVLSPALILHLTEVHRVTAIIGISALLFLLFARYGLSTLLHDPRTGNRGNALLIRLLPLAVVFLATTAVAYFKLDMPGGVAVVGAIPAGLPSFDLFMPGPTTMKALALPALLMAVIGLVQNISMAQALAITRRERIDANAELVGLGAANVIAAFYGGMPVGGGVSRSAVNIAAGARTPLASIVSALTMMLIVTGSVPRFNHLPLAALAASIMVAAISMVDLASFRRAWNYDRADALALIGTAGGVVLLGVERGIAVGVALSLATFLYRASTPHIAVVGRIPGSEHFRNVERHGVETVPDVLMLRVDESLFFGNLSALENRLALELGKAASTRHLVLILSAANRIDTTAVEALFELNRDLANRGILLHLAEVKGPLQDRLAKSQLLAELSGEVFLSANSAFEALLPARSRP